MGNGSACWREDAREGDDAPDLLEAIEPFLLNASLVFDDRGIALLSRAGAMPEKVLPATPPVVPTVLPLKPV